MRSPTLKKWRYAWSARKSQWLLVCAACQTGDAAWKRLGIPTTGITPPFNSVTTAFKTTPTKTINPAEWRIKFSERINQITLSQNAAQTTTSGWAFQRSQSVTVSIMILPARRGHSPLPLAVFSPKRMLGANRFATKHLQYRVQRRFSNQSDRFLHEVAMFCPLTKILQ
jgi:hypothetical protein